MPPNSGVKLPLAYEFACAAAAGTCTVSLTNPMEVVKIRLQCEHIASSQTRNPLLKLIEIARTEGLRGTHAGLLPGIFYQISVNGTRLGAFDHVKSVLPSIVPDAARPPLAGALCGVTAACLSTPFLKVKVRLQNKTESSIFAAIRNIITKEGPLGLYRGAAAAMLRVTVASAAQLGSYDTVKTRIANLTGLSGFPLFLTSSLSASIAVISIMNPFDVVQTRLFSSEKGQYRHIPHVFAHIVRTEGLAGLYRGAIAHYFRVGPHTILIFCFWEQFKLITHSRIRKNKGN